MSDPTIVLPSSSDAIAGAATVAIHPVAQFVGDEDSGEDLPVLPDPGEEFLGFRLIAELGRGSFGKVFLARQKSLADRPVALKVSGELFDETQTLAQLQHTNIVPIYSAHRAGRLQAVCMPYFGATTLADIVRGLRRGGDLPTTGRHFVTTIESRSSRQLLDESHSSSDASYSKNGDGLAPHSPRLIPGAQPTYELLNHYSFVEAVLWLGARLADGLAHAHERGVIHRDLKPANVLLADDGRPMLLDFNLSTNPRHRSSTRGGTVPYMAPEQFQIDKNGQPLPVDARADIYAWGLILYELLTGHAAWPRHKGPASEVVPKLLADRRQSPPAVHELNHGVSPAVEAIVRRCLAFNPRDRYPTARALHEDIERQLAHQTLKHTPEPSLVERAKKWTRRHPRLASMGTLSAVAAAIVIALGLGLWNAHFEGRKRDAREAAQQFLASDDLRNSLIRSPDSDDAAKALDRAKVLFAPYDVAASNDWQKRPLVANLDPDAQAKLRERMGEMLLLTAQRSLEQSSDPDAIATAQRFSDLAGACYVEKPLAWWWQRQSLCERLNDSAGAAIAHAELGKSQPITAGDHYLLGLLRYQAGRYATALSALERATQLEPQHYWAWVLQGNCRYQLNQDDEAISAYTVALGINAKNYRPYYNRGQAPYRQRKLAYALEDFEEAIKHGCTKAEAQLQQAKCHVARYEALKRDRKADPQHLTDAEAILTNLIDKGQLVMRAHHARADVRRRKSDKKGAADDQAQVLKLEPVTAADYLAHGQSQAVTNPKAALEDFREASRNSPFSVAALMSQANVLSERLNQNEESLAALNKALEIAPEYPAALGGRAILLARLGRVEEALRDAETCLTKFDHPFIRYQMAGVYALTAERPGHVKKAVQLIASAVSRNFKLAELIATDPDLKPIEKSPELRKLREATSVIRTTD